MKNKCLSNVFSSKKLKVAFMLLLGTMALMVGFEALAAEPKTIGKVAETITGSFSALAQLITAGSYLLGLGFFIGAIMKFKQHKDNPTQIPIGTPIAMLFIAAALLFLPNLMGVAGSTIFGKDARTASPTGIIFKGAGEGDKGQQ